MKRKTLLAWSTGKDSAWALYKLKQDPDIDLCGLFCTTMKNHNCVSMHGVKTELLHRQTKAIGLPLEVIEIPYPCDDDTYKKIMTDFVEKASNMHIKHFAFGDLFLEEVREYREKNLRETR